MKKYFSLLLVLILCLLCSGTDAEQVNYSNTAGGIGTINTTAPLAGGGSTSPLTLSITGVAGMVPNGVSSAFTATPTLGTNGGTGGSITLNGSASGSDTIQTAAAAGTSTIFQLPATNGTNGFVLQTNGSGVTSWVAQSGGITALTTDVTASGTGSVPATVTGIQGVPVYAANDTTVGGTIEIGPSAFTGLPASAAYSSVGIGYQVFGGGVITTSAVRNVGIGYQVLKAITNGSHNTVAGYTAGTALTTGTDNVILGYQTGSALTQGQFNVLIGDGVASGVLTTGSRQILIGPDSSVTSDTAGQNDHMNLGNALYAFNMRNNTNTTGVPQVVIGYGATAATAGAALDLSSNSVAANSSLLLPVGTSGGRPSVGVNGMIRYSTTSNNVEGFINGNWFSLATASGGTITGSPQFQLPYYSASGTASTLTGTSALTTDTNGVLTITTSTVTTTDPALTINQTWNGAAQIFTGILENITNTTSAATSLLLNLQVGGTSKFKVDVSGNATAVGSITPSQTAGIIGTTTNNNANTGTVGEFAEANCPFTTGTATITNASPGVVTYASSTMTGVGTWTCAIYFTTSGSLNTGLSVNTTYYIIPVTATTFQLATTAANALAGTAINTSSAGTGTQTAHTETYLPGTGTAVDVAAVSLGAGDWDMNGCVAFADSTSTSLTQYNGWVSTTSATTPALPGHSGYAQVQQEVPNTAGAVTEQYCFGPSRALLSGSGTGYNSAQANYSGGSGVQMFGSIQARRMR